MRAYLINIYLVVPRSRYSVEVKVKYQGHVFKKMAIVGGGIHVSQTHLVKICPAEFKVLMITCKDFS